MDKVESGDDYGQKRRVVALGGAPKKLGECREAKAVAMAGSVFQLGRPAIAF